MNFTETGMFTETICYYIATMSIYETIKCLNSEIVYSVKEKNKTFFVTSSAWKWVNSSNSAVKDSQLKQRLISR